MDRVYCNFASGVRVQLTMMLNKALHLALKHNYFLRLVSIRRRLQAGREKFMRCALAPHIKLNREKRTFGATPTIDA